MLVPISSNSILPVIYDKNLPSKQKSNQKPLPRENSIKSKPKNKYKKCKSGKGTLIDIYV